MKISVPKLTKRKRNCDSYEGQNIISYKRDQIFLLTMTYKLEKVIKLHETRQV